MTGCENDEHAWGPPETAMWTGEPHRKCLHCRFIYIDFEEEDE